MSVQSPHFHYSKDFEVLSFQVNPEKKLRWAALGDILQELAWKHADSRDFGQQLHEQGRIWVLSRFSIEVKRMPVWGDVLKVHTAARGVDKLFALREFLVEDQNGEILATAMSAWILLDVATRRPLRPQQVLPVELFPTVVDINLLPPKIQVPANMEKGPLLEVGYADLDINHHVNNVAYIRWIEGFCFSKHWNFAILHINYLSETHLGEQVQLSYFQEEGRVFLEGLVENRQVFTALVVF